jgi:hypothetical protein
MLLSLMSKSLKMIVFVEFNRQKSLIISTLGQLYQLDIFYHLKSCHIYFSSMQSLHFLLGDEKKSRKSSQK